MDNKIERAIMLYPWYWGVGADLLFYVAIDTLFLVTVKHFSEMWIVLLTAISTIVGITLRFPLLWIIKKMGNTSVIRMGAFCLLLSSVLITVGPNFFVVALGRSFRNVTYLTNEVAVVVALENNLEQVGRPEDFIKYRTRGNTHYAAITLVIALVATFLFNIYNYLPMICCIFFAAVAFVLSFFISDYSNHNRPIAKEKKKNDEFKMETFMLLAFLVYGIAYTAGVSGIGDAKLFIQQDLLKKISLEMTATIIGGTYFLARLGRLLSNMIFVQLYTKLRIKTGIFIAGMLTFAYSSLLLGSAIPVLPVKILVMGVGYLMILFAVDPTRHYIQQVFVKYAPREQHQNLFAYMGFAYNICTGISSVVFSLVLLRFTMTGIMVICFAMSAVSIVLMSMMYKLLIKRK